MKLQYRGEILDFEEIANETIEMLAVRCAERIGASTERISLLFLGAQQPGLVKSPFPKS